jgi:hypothetical protein
MRILALLVGLFAIALGGLGLVAPDTFVAAVRFMQDPPWLYLAAAIRLGVGIILLLAAPASRFPTVFRVIGAIVAIGGLLTPFIGQWLAKLILGWWTSGGPGVVRAWAVFALAFGSLVIRGIAPKRARR